MGSDFKQHQRATWLGLPLKPLSLILLIFQNAGFILLMHQSRVMPAPGGHRYLTSTAIFMNEVLKLTVCLTASLYETSRNISPSLPATSLFSTVSAAVFTGDSWKLAIPASLYVLQNSLQYVAISNLDAATFQVTYQFKILPTAIFSILLLKKSLSLQKWLSLALLMIGVAIVQIPMSDPHLVPFKVTHPHWHLPRTLEDFKSMGGIAAHHLKKRSATYEGIAEDEGLLESPVNAAIGFVAAIAGCTVSALASVYFEKILKESNTPASLWIRNVQLAFYSLFPSLFIGVMFVDGEAIAQHGFFVGYNWFVWLVILCQAVGGVLVSMCIMYTDNIAKSFAMSLSILLGLSFSVIFLGFSLTSNYLIGTIVVLLATYLYNTDLKTISASPPPIQIHDYEKSGNSNGSTHSTDLASVPSKISKAITSPGFTTSRPSSPKHHHYRVGSSREHFAAKSREE